jgi:tetratricopeptide (TPR) repeat protein
LALRGKTVVELDPAFASAYAMAAWCHYIPVPFWTVPEEVPEAERLARLAARLGPNNAAALSVAGFVVASVAHDFGTGLALIDRAVVLNPNLVNAWYLSGWVKVLNGEHEVALEHFSRAECLSPFDPFKWGCHLGVAYAHFMAGRDDQALSSVEHCLRDMPNFRPALLVVAASSAFLGATDRAKTPAGAQRGSVYRRRLPAPEKRLIRSGRLLPPLPWQFQRASVGPHRPADHR